MRPRPKTIITSIFLSVFFLIMFSASAFADNYHSLKGLKSAKAMFDFRIDDPTIALAHLKLIHETYKEKAINNLAEKPDFVVVFMGPSVKLLSSYRGMFWHTHQETLAEIDKVLAAMSKDGIRLEACMVAARMYGVDPGKMLPEIQHVENGWISSAGYQNNGYALIPAL